MFSKSILFCLFIGLINCSSIKKSIESNTELNQQSKFNHHDFYLQFQQQSNSQRCDDARLKCAFRLDCGQALTSYMIHCADLISGSITDRCPSKCSRALIALASTEQGSKLVDCDCGNSEFCKLSKERIDVCRSKVEHEISENTIVSCSTAKFICSSNTQCLTALTYYNKFCKSMFIGKHCSKRCLNSLNILQRQRNANKLRTCICDGTEDFPCENIKQNTELLCFKNSNYTSNTTIELLKSTNKDQRTHHHLRHRHRNHHHHHFKHHNFEHHRSFKNQQLNRNEFDSTSPFETSPLDLEQIKKNLYFDIMMSSSNYEALSSNSVKLTKFNFVFIFIFTLLNFVFKWSFRI